MKIVHCLNQYMPMAMAGTEIYTHTLATLQQSSGHEVAVVTPHIEHYRPGKMNEHYLYDGIDVYQYLEPSDPANRQIYYGNKKPEGIGNFKQLLVQLQPDIIHFHELNRSIGFTTAHVKIAKETGAKIFLTIHLSTYTCNTNILVRDGKLCDGIIREKTCTICSYKTLFNIPSIVASSLATVSLLSESTGITSKLHAGKVTTLINTPLAINRIKNELSELSESLDQFVSYAKWYKKILLENGVPENKITVVPAALVTTKKQIQKKVSRQEPLPVRIVFIGRIQSQKGIHLIIEALKHFSANQAVIDLYGKEEDTGYYKKCREASKDAGNINWRGAIDRNEVLDALCQYDILCLASTFSEMSPLVIQEAFAAGLPVLASKVYGNMEQVTDNYNGMLFEFNSAKSLQEKIQVLVNKPGLIENMKSNVVAPANFEEVHQCYLRIYNYSESNEQLYYNKLENS